MRVLGFFLLAAWLTVPAHAAVLDRARESGTLRLGYRTDAAPFSTADAAGLPSGYSVELCKSVVEAVRTELAKPDLAVEWKMVGAEDRFSKLASGEVDLLCGADTLTLSRRAEATFSLLTFAGGSTLLYRADGPSTFDALAGQKVGVRAGTTTEERLKEGFAAAGLTVEIVPVGDHEDGIRRLASGELAAYFGDSAILTYQLLRSPERDKLRLSERIFGFEPYALVMPKDDTAFQLVVDRTLARIYRSREIERVFVASFGAGARPSELLRALYVLNALPE